MTISEEERQEILKAAKFLEEKGYSKIQDDEHIILYSNGIIKVGVCCAPYEEFVEVYIVFPKRREYDIDDIAWGMHGMKIDTSDRLNASLKLLGYIDYNYDNLMREDYCELGEKLAERKLRKLEVATVHSSDSLTREEAEKIIKENYFHRNINMNENREDQPHEMVVRKIDNLWHVYRTGASGRQKNGSCMTFEKEEEAWGNLVMRLRASSQNTFLTSGINTEMTRQEAKIAIFWERLKHYNLNPKKKDGKNKIVIREIGGLWYVYFTDGQGKKVVESEVIFEQEKRAWGFFVECLRNRAQDGDFFETLKNIRRSKGINY